MEVSHLRCEIGNKVPARRLLASGSRMDLWNIGVCLGALGACPSFFNGHLTQGCTFSALWMDLRTFAEAQKQWVPPSHVLAAMENGLSVRRRSPDPAGTCHEALQMGVFFSCSGLAILVDYCLLNVRSGSWQVGEACG